MPTFLVAWSALTFAAYTGYLGLAPWLRRRPVRVTPTRAVVSLVVALGPGLVYLVVQGARGGQGLANPGLLALAVFGGGLAVVGTAWRGTQVFHGTTAETFREAWRAALAHLGLAYEPLVGGSGRVERVALTSHRDRVELELVVDPHLELPRVDVDFDDVGREFADGRKAAREGRNRHRNRLGNADRADRGEVAGHRERSDGDLVDRPHDGHIGRQELGLLEGHGFEWEHPPLLHDGELGGNVAGGPEEGAARRGEAERGATGASESSIGVHVR